MREVKRWAAFGLRYTYGVLCSLYVFSFGILSSRHRHLISTICEHFGYTGNPRRLFPAVSLSGFLSRDIPLHILEPEEVDGSVSPLELIVLAKLTRLVNPKTLLEIGTFDGRTALNLAANSPADAAVYTLDLPSSQLSSAQLPLVGAEKVYIKKELFGSRFIGTPYESKIIQLWGDSATFDFSQLMNKVDLVFVDGSHSYEYALNDSRVALGLLRNKRGLIVWHDYGVWKGVTKALNELFLNDADFRNLSHIQGTSLAYLTVDLGASLL